MELRGAITILRGKRLEDAPIEYQWRSDAELARLDATLPLAISYDEFLRLFKGQLRYPTPGSHRLSIDTLDGVYVGNCMYYDIDIINKEAEIGIIIGNRHYWGKGYGYDVLVTLVDYIFSSTSLRRLYLHTLEWNKRARRCFEKCGFISVRRVRRSAHILIQMELSKSTWEEIKEEKLAVRSAQLKVGL